jgi:hypothetical protein
MRKSRRTESQIVGVLKELKAGGKTNPAYPIAVGTDLPRLRTTAPSHQCKWLLGDFASLGRFLTHQISIRDVLARRAGRDVGKRRGDGR